MNILGQRIRERREFLRLTQTDLATDTESSQKQIWGYETGNIEPSVEKLKKLADVLGTTSDYLLGLSDEVNPRYQDSDLDTKERELLKIYRAKPRDKQESILAMAQVI